MNNLKKIKSSKRGLTFTIKDNNNFGIGKQINYIAIPKSNKIFIVPGEKIKISRKKSTTKTYGLVDIRNKSINKVTNKATKLNIEVKSNSIIVTGYNDDLPLYECRTKYNNDISFKDNIIKVVSLFSGAGMLDYPFKLDSAFDIVFANELSKDACLSYKSNIGITPTQMNIRDIKSKNIPNGDFLLGGVSCRPYSEANRSHKRLLLHDDSDLLLEYIRIANEGDYKAFAIENVQSFVTSNNYRNIKILKECLPEYNIDFKVFKDSECGGYSIRKRVFVIGSIFGAINWNCIKPTIGKTVRDAISKVTPNWYNFNDLSVHKDKTLEIIKSIPIGGNLKSLNLGDKNTHSSRYKRLDADKPSPSIVNIRKTLTIHPFKDRAISVAEALAISGFDENFKLIGPLNAKQQQVANGVPFNLGHTLMKLIKNIFKECYLR